MPGWYIHMEAAKKATDRLRAGELPPDFPLDAGTAMDLGEAGHTWRNYLAAGALGPDIFFLLPDFKGDTGNTLLHIVRWVREVWEWLDEDFVSKWEKWAGPAITGAGDLLNQLSGGVLAELGQAMQELAGAVKDAIIALIAEQWDWFGLLTSGVPQGFEESAFFWSDVFHYRRTYEFGQALLQKAQAGPAATRDQHTAFALGWMSHCATDVVGHAFVNQKVGGPYRLHWQRHHLVENHLDAKAYDSQHPSEPYGEFGSAALHFRIAFRQRNDAPYNGATDAPAYDYFTGFPSYDPSPAGDFQRQHLWDLDTGDLPEELCQLILGTMREQFYGGTPGDPGTKDAPQILTDDPGFNDGSGRPSVKTMQDTWWTLYEYLKFVTTDAYAPRKPPPPDVLGDHSPPPFPGSDGGVSDDPTRGADPDSDDSWNLLDLLLALFAWAAYIVELGIWLATLPIAVVNDILSYPAREVLYELAVAPLWSLYLAARAPLVMTGFLVPKPEEINQGLAELGVSPTGSLTGLAAALASPTGTFPGTVPFDEPSGRANAFTEFGTDPAYPRAIVADEPNLIESVIGYLFPGHFCVRQGDPIPPQPSEFLAPWRYPLRNIAGMGNGWEAALSHAGPFVQGQDARVLLGNSPGSPSARAEYEKAADPPTTEAASANHLPANEHLGDAVEYSTYLIGRLASGAVVDGFNLDADRGYGYKAWEWDRNDRKWTPSPTGLLSDPKYSFGEPCTIPEGFCEVGGPSYNPMLQLAIHYGERPDGCAPGGPGKVTSDDIKRAGSLPTGERG